MTEEPLPLFTVYLIRCGYSPMWCNHEVRDTDPDQAAKLMGDHYEMHHYGKHKPITLLEVGHG